MKKQIEKLIEKYEFKITYYERTSLGANDISSEAMKRAYKEVLADLKNLNEEAVHEPFSGDVD